MGKQQYKKRKNTGQKKQSLLAQDAKSLGKEQKQERTVGTKKITQITSGEDIGLAKE